MYHSQERSACPVKTTAPLFDIEDGVVARPLRRVTPVVVEASEDKVIGVAGIALFGDLLGQRGLPLRRLALGRRCDSASAGEPGAAQPYDAVPLPRERESRAAKRARATNVDVLRRAWAMGAAPAPGRLTIDLDATYTDTRGKLAVRATIAALKMVSSTTWAPAKDADGEIITP